MSKKLVEEAQAAREQAAVAPVVNAFQQYYELHGPDKAEGLLAGLIKFKAQLDADDEPFKN